MTSQFQPGAVLNTQSFGNRPEGVEVPVIAARAPTASDNRYPIGKRWVDDVANAEYTLTSISTAGAVTTATWTPLTPGVGDVSSITGTANQITASAATGAVTLSIPSSFILGTTNQITATPSGGSTTLSIPAAFAAPGQIIAAFGNISTVNGNLVLGGTANKIVIAPATNSSLNTTAAMSGSPGSVVVSTTAATASSKIIFCRATAGGTLGNISISSQGSGTFTLLSDQNETSTFNYLVLS